jgi:hypothetical protein
MTESEKEKTTEFVGNLNICVPSSKKGKND